MDSHGGSDHAAVTACDDVEVAVEAKATDEDIYYDAISAVDSRGSTKPRNGTAKSLTRTSICNGQSGSPTTDNNIHKELAQELSDCLACRASGGYELAKNVNLFLNSSPPTSPQHYEFAHTLGFVVDTSFDTNRTSSFQRQREQQVVSDQPNCRTKSRLKSNHSHRASTNLESQRDRRQTELNGDKDTNESVYSEPLDAGFLLVRRPISKRHMSWRRRMSIKQKRSKSVMVDNNDKLRSHPDYTRKSVTSYDVTDRRGKSFRRRQTSARKGRPRTNSLPLSQSLPGKEENPYCEAAHSGSVSEGDENIYEAIEFRHRPGEADSDVSWGSEFDSSSDSEYEFPSKPLPAPPQKSNILPFILQPHGHKNASSENRSSVESEDDGICLPVKINTEKHPPPALPPAPENLEMHQVKRRHVIANIIDSERSYIESLERIIVEYEEPMLKEFGFHSSPLKLVLKESHDILSHHRIFQIELAEKVSKWDEEEKIGDIFTATFSKIMIQDAYSTYVNNFSAATEDIKAKQRTDAVFRDFLRDKETKSRDRLPISGLMVKPVQRFPQFIMLMQDILKYTPPHHHDRRALQSALTELENVAHNLNERKRENEQHFKAQQLLNKMNLKFPVGHRRLIREDDMEEVEIYYSQTRKRDRRVFLLNDMIICVNSSQREQDDYLGDKYKHKWKANLRDLEIKESALTPDLQPSNRGEGSRLNLLSPKYDVTDEDPYNLYSDLHEMMHDHNLLKKISELVIQLKRTHEGLNEEVVNGLSHDLQAMIQVKDQQLQIVNSCSIILYDNLRKMQHILHIQTPQMKQSWCQDFLVAKLALDPQNNPGWSISHSHKEHTILNIPAFFMKCINVDMPRHYTKMKCAVPVLIKVRGPNTRNLQHLWVCTNTETRGQVSIISVLPSKSSLIESFQAANQEITCVETVPGFAMVDNNLAIEEDAVWMATANAEILVYKLYDSDGVRRQQMTRHEPNFAFHMPSVVVALMYIEDRIFAGLESGMLVIFPRDDEGVWNIKKPRFLDIGEDPITTMLAVETTVWVACGNMVTIVDWEECTIKEKHQLKCNTDDEAKILAMVRSGVGLFISYEDKSVVRLYHLESKEPLQEINIASSVERIVVKNSTLGGESGDSSCDRSCTVTCMTSSRGLLWIGTNLGIILTLPLPKLQNGVPLLSGRRSVSLHAHNGPVKYIIPVTLHSSGFSSQVKNTPTVVENSDSRANNIGGAEDLPRPQANRRMSMGIDIMTPKHETSHVVVGQPTPFKEAETSLEYLDEESLTFRRELASKLAKRKNLSQSTPNLLEASSEDEVVLLYKDLMKKDDFCVMKSQKCKTLASGWKQTKFTKHWKKLTSDNTKSNTLKSKMVADISYKREPMGVPVDCVERIENKDLNYKGSALSKKSSSSSRSGSQAQRKKSIQSSMLEKCSSANCVVVLSGGDGYVDWRHHGACSAKNNDACMLLWMYKF